MQQVRIHGAGEVRIDEVAAPEPGPRDVVVRVKACGICGSDLGYVADGYAAMPTGKPAPIGHEFSAVVARVGSEVRGFEVGTRVVVNPIAGVNMIGNGGEHGAFAPEVLVQEVERGDVLFPIPDELSFEQAALAEPLGVGMHAVEQAEVGEGDKVAIFGAGPIGLMALATLLYAGREDVVIVDLSDARLEIARKLGAKHTLNPGREDVWAKLAEVHGTALWMDFVPTAGTDAYIEASGSAAVLESIVAQARPGARIALVALHKQPEALNLVLLMAKELTLRGSMAYPEDYTRMIRMLGEVDLSPALTHRFELANFHEALATAQNAELAGKVLVQP
jgi:threonine dehydrogenase-like Zn-dependent dehydrogenase